MKSYYTDVRIFEEWCVGRGLIPFPAVTQTVCAFLEDQAASLTPASVRRRLYAIGVFEVELSQGGRVGSTRWLRGPSHAPEVMAEIERLVRAAAPFPSPPGFGRVQYVDTWLWDRSGRFQLDTLTEGQRNK